MKVAIDKSSDKAGIYAAGEGEEDDLEDEIDYVPREAVQDEMGVEEADVDEVPGAAGPSAPEAEPE